MAFQSPVTSHSRLLIPSYQSLALLIPTQTAKAQLTNSYQSLALLIPAFKLQGTSHERTLFS